MLRMSKLFMVSMVMIAACGRVDDGEEGPPGPAGPQGEQGQMGEAGDSVTVTVEPAGANCSAGGFKLVSTTGTSYVCRGVKGGAPVGAVLGFAGPGVPDGWLACDGSGVSRTQYSALFSVMGTSWGAGGGVTTFHIP